MKFKGHSEGNAARVLPSWPFDDPSLLRDDSNNYTTFLKHTLQSSHKSSTIYKITLATMTRAQQTITVLALLITVRSKLARHTSSAHTDL